MVLGGGFGGVATANTLRPLLGAEHRIVLIDRAPAFHVGAGKIGIALGERTQAEISRPRSELLAAGVEERRVDVVHIDLASSTVRAGGEDRRWEHLVIALGADLNLKAVPGLAGAAHNFYTVGGAERLRGALAMTKQASSSAGTREAPDDQAVGLVVTAARRAVNAWTRARPLSPEWLAAWVSRTTHRSTGNLADVDPDGRRWCQRACRDRGPAVRLRGRNLFVGRLGEDRTVLPSVRRPGIIPPG